MKLASWSLLAVAALTGCSHPAFEEPPFEGPPFPFDGGPPPFVGPQPSFGATVKSATPPPPLSGGTLRVLADGKTAVASDPDRDQVYVADLSAATPTLLSTIALNAGDEPGRIVDDAAGRVHVVTRRGGALVTIDPAKGTILYRRDVCAAPRGVAYEPATDRVHVACAGGELVSLPAAGGAAVRTLQLDPDLRDVLVSGGWLWVSTFRTANLLLVDANGAVAKRFSIPPSISGFNNQTFQAAVAWRLQSLPDGRVAMVHQLGLVDMVEITQGGYGSKGGGGCGGIVESAIALFDANAGFVADFPLLDPVLPVDFTVAHTAGSIAVASAGNSHTPALPQMVTLPLFTIPSPPDMGGGGMVGGGCLSAAGVSFNSNGEITSLAYDGQDRVWAQTREPAQLVLINAAQASSTTLLLSPVSRADTGWAVFHSNSGAGLACASCHPEGGEDGRVWQFANIGGRRTQSLRGNISGTEPFHWNGDLPNFDALLGEVYVRRMSGPVLAADQKTALSSWIDTIPTLKHSPPADPAAVARGQALFEDTQNVGCSTCHAGPQLTNNATVDVGTGGSFQVPRLVGVSWRPPFLHDGCAATLADRFGSCGGGDQHGITSKLTAAQKADLIAYLSTL